MVRMATNGNRSLLGTPSGAKPAWLSLKYPEIRRMSRDGIREGHAGRHNNCNSSPVYRKYVTEIDSRLAERYAKHPALGGFHISNEFNAGECHCDKCRANFRKYLKNRYGTIEELNRRLWSDVWSHSYTSFDEIDAYDFYTLDGLVVDFKRFNSELQADFLQCEIDAVRKFSSAPVTTNMMGFHNTIDYWKIAEKCDFIADDCYPLWNSPSQTHATSDLFACRHDMHRAMKGGKPFVMIESTPSTVTWANDSRLKRPGVHKSEMLTAIAHGSDGAMYFQWRKSRGGLEKLHGSVVSHDFGADTRVFREVEDVGRILEKLSPSIVGTTIDAKCAVVYDWDTSWAVESTQGLTSQRNYHGTFLSHYRALSRNHVQMDVIQSDCDFSKYSLIVIPMLFMLKDGVAKRLAKFVEAGGTLVATYLTGYVNCDNLCYVNGTPGDGLADVLGVRVEEFDGFTKEDTQGLKLESGGTFTVSDIAERFRTAPSAKVLARYTDDFYAGEAAVTMNQYGNGKAYYLGARTSLDMLEKFYSEVIDEAGTGRVLPREVSGNVHASVRTDGEKQFLFIFNPGNTDESFALPDGYSATDILTDEKRPLSLAPFEVRLYTKG